MHQIKLTTTLLALTLILTSCGKEEALDTRVQGHAITDLLHKSNGENNLDWVRDESGEQDHQCPPPGNKCTKFETGISQPDNVVLTNVFTAIRGEDGGEISSAFATHKEVLLEYLPTDLVEAVILEQLVPSALHNASDDLHFMIFRDEPDEQVFAFNL